MNSYSDQIQKALLAHGAWKQRLRAAIAEGQSEYAVSQVRLDDRCDFGKWFYSLSPSLRTGAEAKAIQSIHAEFHQEASRILDLALHGQKDEALADLGASGSYTALSGRLALALRQWEKTLA